MRREAHQIFVDPEELEIFQIHLVHGVEFRVELFRRAVNMRVVHLQRAHPHESEKLAALLVAITSPVFRQSQRQIAITARQRSKQLVVMRTVHRFEVVTICLALGDHDGCKSTPFRQSVEPLELVRL